MYEYELFIGVMIGIAAIGVWFTLVSIKEIERYKHEV